MTFDTRNTLTFALLVPLLFTAGDAANAQTETVLYSFGSQSGDGANSFSGLTLRDGRLYGTTNGGGSRDEGTIFELVASPNGGDWTERVLHSFGSQSEDGKYPYYGSLIVDRKGSLYGTTNSGGVASEGTVFQLSPPTTQGRPWRENILYSFGARSEDGSTPYGGLHMDTEGNIYGTTGTGGANGQGTVFKVSPPLAKAGPWSQVILYSFGSQSGDGNEPLSGLIADEKGNLYGTTYVGGSNFSGTVFELSPPTLKGGAWIETILHSFGSYPGDGLDPVGGLILKDGRLYGTTTFGSSGAGTAFELSPPEKMGDSWTETILLSSLESPYPTLIMDRQSNLYGTTLNGGTSSVGTAFELSPPAIEGGTWGVTILYSFGSQGGDGFNPYGGLAMSEDGKFYGTTSYGGAHGSGTVFEVAQ